MRSLLSKIQPQQATVSVAPHRPSKEGLTLTRLVCRQEWSILDNILLNDPQMLPIDDAVEHSISEELVVHFACRFQAPLNTIRLLADQFPESLKHADATGRFPVHIAAKWGAMPDVIHFLIKSNADAAGIQDDLGKTPMHYVGESYSRNYQDVPRSSRSVADSMLSVVKLLRTAAPKSVNLEDNEGINAIEYAIENDADLKVIKSMQRACRDDWREMKKQCKGKSHAELEKDLERMASSLQMSIHSRQNVLTEPIIRDPNKLDGRDNRVHIQGPPEIRVHAARSA